MSVSLSVKGGEPLLSIIVPVYNEKKTFLIMMDLLLKKKFKTVDTEIIIVEGNSEDGTRTDVLRFEGINGIKLILLEKAQGKGHAVRQGLKQAKGDIILIQDADLEYDIDDYDALLEPLLTHQCQFVLGSRHLGNWKIRKFKKDLIYSSYLNFGHLFFTSLFNRLYKQNLSDPWTMYKIFRKECLQGVEFESNRFNFDVELVSKLVRLGFHPIEIPVSYASRSFEEGKKINIWIDPWTWLWALIKYRFVSPIKKD